MNQDPDQERNVALLINPKDYSKAKYMVLNRKRTLTQMHADNNTNTLSYVGQVRAHATARMRTYIQECTHNYTQYDKQHPCTQRHINNRI